VTTPSDQETLAARQGLRPESGVDEQDVTMTTAPGQPPDTEAGSAAAAISGQWAAMVDENKITQKATTERVLNQEEIDGLLGFSLADVNLNDNSGIRAIIDSAMVSYERLPMLEIVFDRLVRLLTTSLRNFTSDNVEVSLDRITSVRFGDYINSIPLPAILAVFKAEQWDNFGLITVNSSLIYSMIDVLLGGRRGSALMRVEGRPYTTIETSLVKRMIEVILADAELAFKPL
jgi:flagellar motor switch protein FliM